jgi:uncharacterized protein YjbI with pentapeptide repeats
MQHLMHNRSNINSESEDTQEQDFLQNDLHNRVQSGTIRQAVIEKAILTIGLLILYTLLGVLCSFTGSLVILKISVSTPNRFEYLLAAFPLFAWLIATAHKNITKGLITSNIVLLIEIIFIELAHKLGIINASPDFIIATIAILLFCLSISIICFMVGNFALTLEYVLFSSNKSIAKIYYLITIGTILITSFELISSGFLDSRSLGTRFSSLPAITITVTFLGSTIYSLIFSYILITSSRRRRWNYSDSIWFYAVAIGSWGGTSFYDLNLSGVSFKGAKLANIDLRARKLYRTCLQGVTGLERARVDSRYLDLEDSKVQRLLTHASSKDKNFSRLNLQGAYLQGADMQAFNLTETNLTGADLRNADLRESILVRTQVMGVDFTRAKLTGVCIQDWSVNSQTCFANVECNYIYRELTKDGRPTARYPVDRDFEPREFEALFQEVGNVVELVFKEGVNWRALSFTFRKFQLEDEGLGLELKGVEQRGDLWVVKVTHKEGIPRQEVEQRVNAIYDDLKSLIAVKEQQFDKLLNIAADQAKALKESSRRPFGSNNSFFILGSTITNLAGSGQIDYDEAANKVRSIVANSSDSNQVKPLAQTLLNQLQGQSIATTEDKQVELIQEVMLTEANNDLFFRQFLLQQGQQVIDAMPESVIARAIQQAIAHLTP